MDRYIGLDVHATSTTAGIVDEHGKRLGHPVLETNGHVLVEFCRVQPGRVHLAAFPNPATARASLALSVPFAGCQVHLRILSPSGRVVHDVREWVPDAGMHTLTWDTSDASGTPVGSGVYLCEVALGESVARQKLTVLR